ncbi:MAG: thioesterase II family protein [Waterburya sp.]
MKSLITCPKPKPHANLRLFCLPYAGGSSWIYRQWSDNCPEEVEVCAIELPGRGTQIKLPPLNRLNPLVKIIAIALEPYLDKPFAFFGHSMGALISFELTRLLRQQVGVRPVHLFVSGHRAPQILNFNPYIHTLPTAEFLLELNRFQGTPETVLENNELMELFLPILRADLAVVETYLYTHESPVRCPITAFGGFQDKIVSFNELERWREMTSSYFSLQMFQGNHFYLHSAQSLLLQTLFQELTTGLLVAS